MSLPIGPNELADLNEFTVTVKKHNQLPQKSWEEWYTAWYMPPSYKIKFDQLQIIVKCEKPDDFEIVLPESDVLKGWTIVWEP